MEQLWNRVDQSTIVTIVGFDDQSSRRPPDRHQSFRPFLGPTRPIATVLLYRAPGVRQPGEMVSEGLGSMRAVADHYWATCYPDA